MIRRHQANRLVNSEPPTSLGHWDLEPRDLSGIPPYRIPLAGAHQRFPSSSRGGSVGGMCATRASPAFSPSPMRTSHAGGDHGSRPVGWPDNARARACVIDQLKLIGFEVRVQETDARRRSSDAARVSNVIGASLASSQDAIGLSFCSTTRHRPRRAQPTMGWGWRWRWRRRVCWPGGAGSAAGRC